MTGADIDIESREWQDVRTLFGAYLHQDYDAVHGEAWDAVNDFARESKTPRGNRDTAHQLRRLLAELEEDELEDVTERWGMAYAPTYDGYSSYRLWLTAVAEHLEDPEAHPGPPERDAPSP